MKRNLISLKTAAVVCLFFWGFAQAAEPGSFFADGPKGAKAVALTFDDGPGPYTEKILEILQKYGVTATFFVDASQLEKRPGALKRAIDQGHEIGSHLYSHTNFYTYKNDDFAAQLEKEIDSSEAVFEKTLGFQPKILRMPHGYVRKWVKEAAGKRGYVLVNWSFGCDWQKMSADEMAAGYIRSIKPGAIFLFHDGGKGRQTTVEILPKIIEKIQKNGYKILSVSELLGLDTAR